MGKESANLHGAKWPLIILLTIIVVFTAVLLFKALV
jgi:hypothetical protein